VLALIVIVAGIKAVNYSTDFKFYSHYLLKWESALTRLFAQDIILPHFSGKNHVRYMDDLVHLMNTLQIEVPSSNTGRPYVYQLSKIGYSKNQDIFLLCFEKKIILYGLSKTTFNMLDKNIDGQPGKNSGKLKGKLQKDNEHYAGIWEL